MQHTRNNPCLIASGCGKNDAKNFEVRVCCNDRAIILAPTTWSAPAGVQSLPKTTRTRCYITVVSVGLGLLGGVSFAWMGRGVAYYLERNSVWDQSLDQHLSRQQVQDDCVLYEVRYSKFVNAY